MSRGNRRFLLTNLQAQIRGVTLKNLQTATCLGVVKGLRLSPPTRLLQKKRVIYIIESLGFGAIGL
jgi:hypothetical protein